MIKITVADRWFALCVKERANWRCERCGKAYERGSQGLHCSHFWSRGRRSVRWDPENAAAHCFGCHQRLGGNPLEFALWVEGYLGEARADALTVRAAQPLRGTKRHERAIARHYRELHFGQQRLRESGVTARIEFADWRRQEDPPLWVSAAPGEAADASGRT